MTDNQLGILGDKSVTPGDILSIRNSLYIYLTVNYPNSANVLLSFM